VLDVTTATALGTTSFGTVVLNGGTLQVESVPALAEPLTLTGAGRGGTNGALYLGPATGVQADMVLSGGATVRNDISFAILSSAISGTGPFTKTGAGTLQLGGGSGAPNTYSGDTIVAEGILVGSKGAGVTTVPGHLIIGTGLGSATATFESFSSFTIVGSVTVNQGGLWDLFGQAESFSIPALEGHPPLTLNDGGDVQTGAGIVYLPVGGDVVVNPGHQLANASSFISGNLGLDPGPHYFTVQHGISGIGFSLPELDLSAVISETSTAADLVKEGVGDMRLSANNSFTGSITVNEGSLTAANPMALGTSAGGTLVNSNASLALEGGIEVDDESLTLDTTNTAALTSLGPVTNLWTGPVTLQRTAGILVPDPQGALTHSGIGSLGSPGPAISGAGGLAKSGPGTLFIGGLIGGNTYTGPTTITDGALEATRAGRSLSDDIVVTGANSVLRTGRAGNLFNSVFTVLPTGASVTVQDGALWTMSPTNSETLSRLAGDGQLQTGSGGTLTVSNDVSCTFSGQVTGSGALKKYGAATFQVTSPYSYNYTGPATVFEGTYKVDGDYRSNAVTVKPSAILRGGGLLGDVTVEPGGVVKVDARYPGVRGGVLGMNSVNFQPSGAVLGLDFFGPDPTGGNDALGVANAVTLGNVNLSAGFLYPPHEGDVVTLITRTAAGAVSGMIGGFPEGSVQMIGQIPVVASYVGGDGNDVTLTVTNLPLGGGGADLLTGVGGGAFVPDDCSQLWLIVTNRGGAPISHLHGTLRSLTPGILVTIADSDYSDLQPNAPGTNVTPFQIRTGPGFPCGGGAQFELVLTASNLPFLAIDYTLPGASGYYLDFDGRNDEVEVASNTFAGIVNNFTIELWANPTADRTETAETNNGISGVSLPSRQIQRFAVFPDRGNLAYGLSHAGAGLSIGKNGISTYEQGTNYLPSRLVYSNAVSGWTHVALVYASRAPRLYVNGALVRSGSASLFPNIHPSASLGGSVQGNYGNFEGQLDEVRIWNVALSQSQIQSNMLQSLTGDEPGLLTYFRCDEGGGGVLTDSAPASPNPTGTLANGAGFVLSDRPTACDPGAGACESCYVFTNTFTTNTPTLSNPLSAEGPPSVCYPPKLCPGPFPLPLPPTPFHIYSFTNTSGAEACVTAQLRFDCPGAPGSALHAAAYLSSVDTNDPCQNYLGDSGPDATAAFSFPVPAGSNVVILVTQRALGIGCDSYQLELFGLPCPPPTLAIEPEVQPDRVRVHWSTAYPDYRAQEAGSPSQTFSNVAVEPAIVNGRYAITNIPTATNRFYRLFKP
jgi:autotransporter-associated beta strand protein